ncbi:hypothetical protein NL676_022959 [Syzygium grande]|nr:hypothetical protein NL676_022959 [Syzygium grande]
MPSLSDKVECLAEKEVGEDCHGRVAVGGKPLDEGEAKGGDDGDVVEVIDVANVLDTQQEFGVGRKGKGKGFDGGLGGEERVKEGEVLRVTNTVRTSLRRACGRGPDAKACGPVLGRGIAVHVEVETLGR